MKDCSLLTLFLPEHSFEVKGNDKVFKYYRVTTSHAGYKSE